MRCDFNLVYYFSGILTMLMLPVVTISIFLIAVGGNPSGLKIAIVNDEIASMEDCRNSSTLKIVDERRCELNLISCSFLTELQQEKVFFKNFDDAFRDAKMGKIIAIVHFNVNFSKSFESLHFNEIDDFDDKLIDESQIEISMDQTNQQFTLFMNRQLQNAYKNFTMKLMKNCGFNEKLGLPPVNFLHPIYGDFNSDFKTFMAPPMIIVILFYVAACLNSFIFLDERLSGCWNRILLTGIHTSELVLSHVLIQSIVLLVQLIEILMLLKFNYQGINSEQFMLLTVIFATLQFGGLFCGMFVSCVADNMMKAQFVLTGLAQTMLLLSGE